MGVMFTNLANELGHHLVGRWMVKAMTSRMQSVRKPAKTIPVFSGIVDLAGQLRGK